MDVRFVDLSPDVDNAAVDIISCAVVRGAGRSCLGLVLRAAYL